MNNLDFTLEDKIEALKSSGTGVWKLESEVGKPTRFYGDEYMDMLLGVPDDITPEDRYTIFMSRIYRDDMNMFMQYYTTLQDTAQAEIVYRYCHPQLGIIYVRCGGKKTFSDKKSSCYRGFHQNVTNTIRIEQETRKRLTEQAELYQAIASKVMDNFADSTVIINLADGSFEWITVEGERVK